MLLLLSSKGHDSPGRGAAEGSILTHFLQAPLEALCRVMLLPSISSAQQSPAAHRAKVGTEPKSFKHLTGVALAAPPHDMQGLCCQTRHSLCSLAKPLRAGPSLHLRPVSREAASFS